MAAKECPLCGQTALMAMTGEYCLEPPPNLLGGPIVVSEAAWLHCESCGEDILSSDLEAAIERERRRRLGLLRPEEIRNIRERNGLTVADMSHVLGVEEKTYARWEEGRSLPSKSSDALIRQIATTPERFAMRAAQREPGREPSE